MIELLYVVTCYFSVTNKHCYQVVVKNLCYFSVTNIFYDLSVVVKNLCYGLVTNKHCYLIVVKSLCYGSVTKIFLVVVIIILDLNSYIPCTVLLRSNNTYKKV